MSELTIQRNTSFPVAQYTTVEKAEKGASAGASQSVAGKAGVTVSDTLRQLMTRVGQAENLYRESHRTLQMGEAVLAEVQKSLDRIAELVQESAGSGEPDREALQAELEQLRSEIDRMIGSAAVGDVTLFLDGEIDLESSVQGLPDWLMQGIMQDAPDAEQLLAALGLDKNATGPEILAALAGRPLESDPTAGYLATLYLGAVIAGSAFSGTISPEDAMEGLQLLLEKVAEGVPLDQALELLTNGTFTSLLDFQSQFTGGTAPGLQDFLVNVLLTGSITLPTVDFSALLAGLGDMNLELLMGLVTGGSALETGAASGEGTSAAANPAVNPELGTASAAAERGSVLQLGNMQIIGQDLSAVSVDTSTSEITIDGEVDVILRGTAQGEQAVRVTGSGTVILENVHTSTLTVDTAQARICSAGENVLDEIQMREGTSLTLTGNGLLRLGTLRGDVSNILRLTGGAVVVSERGSGVLGTLPVSVIVDGPASLAAQAGSVQDLNGKALKPFDLIWKALLPGWSGITSLAMDGKQAKMSLLGGSQPDPVRLWLNRENFAHGYSIYTLFLRGKDASGRPRARYAYLHWNQAAGAFQAISMYPNPFTVTGGEQGQDWVYEEESHTLHILSSQVTAVSGGAGLDAAQTPFSGRITLADRIGAIGLTLDGVVCRVSSGRAFDLGRENDVTLILPSGTKNQFESGAGCAGICLGENTSLQIECVEPQEKGEPAGTLAATIGAGIQGAGISLQMGEDTVTLPQFRLSSRALQLDRLCVTTREYAQEAKATVEADRRWVSQIQAAYSALYSQLEQSFSGLHSARQQGGEPEGAMRDAAGAGTLLSEMRQSILLRPAQAMHTHRRRDMNQLFR